VTVDDEWLDQANPVDLEVLASALLDGRLAAPFSTGSVRLLGLDPAASAFLAGLGGADPRMPARLLQRLAKERRRADDRYAGVARLVWSGPVEGDPSIRDTRVVVDSLFADAERHVLISTMVIYNGRAVFASLAKRLRARPEIAVEIYVHLPSTPGQAWDEPAEVARFLESFARDNWPRDLPIPPIYYDPEGRKLGEKRSTLHAKCVVVDDRWALVTSANFTEAAQERNIEAGVLLEHPKLAESLSGRFRALRESGRLRRMNTNC
jgi:phosphatidylserine/phosphatidylglycerophosphate/cardiolipin synthase-like enzyme